MRTSLLGQAAKAAIHLDSMTNLKMIHPKQTMKTGSFLRRQQPLLPQPQPPRLIPCHRTINGNLQLHRPYRRPRAAAVMAGAVIEVVTMADLTVADMMVDWNPNHLIRRRGDGVWALRFWLSLR
jgi:hypothetical protein